MRTTLLGLSVPLLLMAAAFATVIPEASAQAEYFEISGRVESDSGDPLQGVRVNAYTYPESEEDRLTYDPMYRGAEAITDENGEYTLKLAAGKGYINVHYDAWRIGDGREIVVTGSEDDVDFTLNAPPPKTAIIQGTVVDSDGRPIEGATVTLGYGCCYAYPAAEARSATPPSDGNASEATTTEKAYASDMRIMPPYYDDHATATTGEDGEFTFKAYGGPRQITAYAKGFAQTTLQITAVDNETTQVEVELEKVPASDAILEGRVVDSDTGLPVGNAQVSVRSLEWGRYAQATTDKEGRYRVQIVPGWAEVSVSVWNYGGEPMPVDVASDADVAIERRVVSSAQYFPLSFLIDLESGDNDREIELDAKPAPTIALVGYVVDPDAKKGVEGAQVSIWNHETGDWGEAKTDKTGSFRILVREGHYTASAWKEGYLGGSQTFAVADDAVQRVDLLLPKGTQKWAPCYDDECGGPILYKDAYAADAPVAASSSGGGDAGATGATTMRAADSDGAVAESGDEAAPPAPERSGAASFPGEGGGLPEYDPSASGTVPGAERASNPVPGAGALALLAVAGIAALVLRRR